MKKPESLILLVSVLLFFVLFMGISSPVFSYPTGVAGRTLLGSSPGCTCHSSSANTNVVVSVTGPLTLLAGQTGTYTFSVSRSAGTFSTGGIDIAVSSGTLGIGTSSGIKILSGEVVQSAKFTGATTKTFTFTAPGTAGNVTMAVTGAGGTNPPAWNHGTSITIVVSPLTGVVKTGEIAAVYNLAQNFPNPFNPITKISYSIPKSSEVSLTVYDILGQRVASLVREKQDAGSYSVDFDASSLSSGVYYYKIQAGDFVSIKKMTLVK
jgi:hypothetical protein